MIVGIDFDNTIVCYDQIFHREAIARDLIAPDVPVRKEAVRDHLRRKGQEDLWTELQGYVYGPGITNAEPYPGILDFFSRTRLSGIKTFIISHKTKFPYAGAQYNLHENAMGWLEAKGFYETGKTGLTTSDVFFSLTKALKLSRIGEQRCSYFFDDLPEFLAESEFPAGVERILFDPNGAHPAEARFKRISNWSDAESLLGLELAR